MTADHPSDTALLRELTNWRLNREEPVQCNACGDRVTEGETTVARLHRDGDDQTWLTTGRFCTECGPDVTRDPKPFAAEVVVRGRVGSASDPGSEGRFPVLLTPTIVDRT